VRLNFKWIVAIGLLLGMVEFFWHRPASKEVALATSGDEPGVLTVRARESVNAPGVTTSAPPPATWQNKVEAALDPHVTTSDQAKNLLALFPSLPPAGQFEAAHHISNLLPDDSYAAWAGYLTNPATVPAVQQVIYSDLLRRPNSVKLPLLLAVARTPTTANSAAAARLLRATLGADYGADWNAWQAGIESWLKQNPDNRNPGFPGMTVGN
jgi:hypothetical protein